MEFAGNRMTVRADRDGTTISWDDKGTGRVCGSCQLCCKLVPVPTVELRKPAGERCKHSKHGKGCTIYENRPFACRTWSCRWLADPETAGLPRPDRAHYVIDMNEDTILLQPHDGSPSRHVPVFQVWVDPAHRYAYRTAGLRDWMQRMARQFGAATIIRWSRESAIVVFAPDLTHDGEWHEMGGQVVPRNEREKREAAILGEAW